MCLQRGLHPLAVSWRPPARTTIGEQNLRNLIALGVDHVDFSIDPHVERKFTLAAFERYGATAIPMHLALFAIPLRFAMALDVPLVVYGENSALEYGGGDESTKGARLDGAWIRRFGVTQGTTAADWVGEVLAARELTPYFAPSDEALASKGVRAVFLGHYFPWDPVRTYETARAHGFRTSAEGARTGHYDFADIDDDLISVHHHMKWYKFGFTRAFDNLSIEIRNGRLSRDEAVQSVCAKGDETPHADIARFCAFVGIDEARFYEIAERFRDRTIWTRREGRWMIDGFLCPDRTWT